MAMVTLTTDSQPFSNDTHPRVASFSSFLTRSEEPIFHKKLQDPIPFGRNKVEDGEISVFSAEKYFNGGMDDDGDDEKPKFSNNFLQVKEKPRIQVGTPSVRSESSWNSQTGLLPSVRRDSQERKKTKKRRSKNFLASFVCNCSCYDKKSVDVDEYLGEKKSETSAISGLVQAKSATNETKTIQNGADMVSCCKKIDELGLGLDREECFRFPILNYKMENSAVKVKLQEEEEDEKKSDSLEVFGSKKNKSSRIERRLDMLKWDNASSSTRMEELQIPAAWDSGMYSDGESDASSDLFEIMSFTNNSNPFLHGQAVSDFGMSSCPTTCYEPSEASIEWSVVTASAADFSAASDYENPISPAKAWKMTGNANGAALETGKRRSGSLLGCNSMKAVRVIGDAHWTNGKASPHPGRCHRPNSFGP
ncbi:hypothetical protein U1Q18_016879 [Sarracenia purpurea var. burkii]